MNPELYKTAMIGTERTQLTVDNIDYLHHHFAINIAEKDVAELVLAEIAVANRINKAAVLPMQTVLPDIADRIVEVNLLVCNTAQTLALRQLFGYSMRNKLPVLWLQCLRKLVQKGYALPQELLTETMDFAKDFPQLWTAIAHCAGAVGEWLIGQNDDWKYAAAELPMHLLDGDSAAVRRAGFQILRARDAHAATDWLVANFDLEPSTTRLPLLKIMELNASIYDIDCLTTIAQAKRKEVRELAVELLATIAWQRDNTTNDIDNMLRTEAGKYGLTSKLLTYFTQNPFTLLTATQTNEIIDFIQFQLRSVDVWQTKQYENLLKELGARAEQPDISLKHLGNIGIATDNRYGYLASGFEELRKIWTIVNSL